MHLSSDTMEHSDSRSIHLNFAFVPLELGANCPSRLEFCPSKPIETKTYMKPRLCSCITVGFAFTWRHVQVKFVESAGLLTRMRKENPNMPDPLPKLEADLKAALSTENRQQELSLSFAMFMILSRDPKPL